MNRNEALDHFRQRLKDKDDHGSPLYAASAYVTAGILTNSDYAKLAALARGPAPFKRRHKRMFAHKWSVTRYGRRGLNRVRDGVDVIEWIDPEPPGWQEKMNADRRAAAHNLAEMVADIHRMAAPRPLVRRPQRRAVAPFVPSSDEEIAAVERMLLASGARKV